MHREIKKSYEYQDLRTLHQNMVLVLERFVTESESRKQVSFLREIKRKLILKVLELGLAEHLIPILPAIPMKCMKIERQMSFVSHYDKQGEVHLNSKQIKDLQNIPHFHPYWLIGVELEMDTIDTSPEQATEIIIKKGRFPLTLSEIISLQIHNYCLGSFSVQACGSIYQPFKGLEITSTPVVHLENNIPIISWGPFKKNKEGDGFKPWVTPSCICRVGTLGVKTFIQGRWWKERRERREFEK